MTTIIIGSNVIILHHEFIKLQDFSWKNYGLITIFYEIFREAILAMQSSAKMNKH
jgi:hypothetical protein